MKKQLWILGLCFAATAVQAATGGDGVAALDAFSFCQDLGFGDEDIGDSFTEFLAACAAREEFPEPLDLKVVFNRNLKDALAVDISRPVGFLEHLGTLRATAQSLFVTKDGALSGAAHIYFLLASYFTGFDLSPALRVPISVPTGPISTTDWASLAIHRLQTYLPILAVLKKDPTNERLRRQLLPLASWNHDSLSSYETILLSEFNRLTGRALMEPRRQFAESRAYSLWKKYCEYEANWIAAEKPLRPAVSPASDATLTASGRTASAEASAASANGPAQTIREEVWSSPNKRHDYMTASSPERPAPKRTGGGKGAGPRVAAVATHEASKKSKKRRRLPLAALSENKNKIRNT